MPDDVSSPAVGHAAATDHLRIAAQAGAVFAAGVVIFVYAANRPGRRRRRHAAK